MKTQGTPSDRRHGEGNHPSVSFGIPTTHSTAPLSRSFCAEPENTYSSSARRAACISAFEFSFHSPVTALLGDPASVDKYNPYKPLYMPSFYFILRLPFHLILHYYLAKTWQFPIIGAPQYKPENTTLLLIGTPKSVPIILGNPLMWVYNLNRLSCRPSRPVMGHILRLWARRHAKGFWSRVSV